MEQQFKILTVNALKEIQSRKDKMHVPADVGRIPRKIESGNGFSGFTADQYKSWVNLFSIPCLHGLLSK